MNSIAYLFLCILFSRVCCNVQELPLPLTTKPILTSRFDHNLCLGAFWMILTVA